MITAGGHRAEATVLMRTFPVDPIRLFVQSLRVSQFAANVR